MGCSMNFVDDRLTAAMYRLGVFIAEHPMHFIIVPVLLTALCATGFQRFRYEEDPEYLFSPTNGRAKQERRTVEEHFPLNYSGYFNLGRITRLGKFAKVIVRPKDEGSVLRQSVWDELLEIDDLVQGCAITAPDGRRLNYSQLCAREGERCHDNNILSLRDLLAEHEAGEYKLTYPVMFDPLSFETYILPLFFGGVELDEDGRISSVAAVSLLWILATNTAEENTRGAQWEVEFLNKMEETKDRWKHIDVTWFASKTMELELERNTMSVLPLMMYTICIMIVFCVTTSMMRDPVRSKPFLGVLGLISAGMATAASFGLIIYCGMPFVGINIAAPFMMMGIGIDDTFVMIAAWRRTKIQDPVSKRLGKTFSEAAVSITITTITDVLSFWVGAITPFPSVQIFSFYTGTAVIFTYICHITFFGACMALSGYREKKNLHSITLKKTIALSEAGSRNPWYRFFCSGGISERDPYNPVDNREHCIMKFFGDTVGKILNLPAMKAFVLTVFLAYLVFACWGLTRIEEGLERRKLSRYDSYSAVYYDWEDKYFSRYPYRVQIIITGDLKYSDPQTILRINELLEAFESYHHVEKGIATESWIRTFDKFKRRKKEITNKTYTSEEELIKDLKEKFVPKYKYGVGLDLHFNENLTKIIATRYIIQIINKTSLNDDRIIMETLREISDNSSLDVTVSHPFFIFFDQFVLVRSTTIQSIAIAAIIMMVVALIFIPNPFCCLWIAFSIISIEIGVMGYMALWNVNLDSISMINLIMCIGFSVDFSAHISYSFMSNPSKDPNVKVRESLYNLGLPITQGSISTILAIIALPFTPSYIFITFFKVIFLVIFFGAIHGLFLLPVLLSLVGPAWCSKRKKENNEKTSVPTIYRPDMQTYRSPISVINIDMPYYNTPHANQGKLYFAYDGPNSIMRDEEMTNSWDEKSEPLDKDLGLGTSGEDSAESSLSKTSINPVNGDFAAQNNVQKAKELRPVSQRLLQDKHENIRGQPYYSDSAYSVELRPMSQFDAHKYSHANYNKKS